FTMATATSCATASFALFLASVCRSRNQLHAVSLVVVLGMSALGGSMIPRYLMSDSMQRLGQFTFNGWALDGFKKIFWYDQPLSAIRTEVVVLMVIAIVLGFLASLLVKRWNIA
ncbi:MAG: ABC transporter permease, partial [bacterium]|nr:ABC transporter permease [bacterium]